MIRELRAISKEMVQGFEQVWVERYWKDVDFLYRVMPRYGAGLFSKN